MIGQRLRLARAAAGLSLRDLAERLDNPVTAQALNKYEHDEMMPGSPVLLSLSRALEVPVSYLLASPEVVLEQVEFRRSDLRARDRARLEARVVDGVQRYLTVEDVLNVASVDWERPRGAPFPVGELPEADRAARSMRADWQLGVEPLPNLAEFLEEKGIKVLMERMPAGVDGLMCRVAWRGRGNVPVIVVNDHKWVSGERQRFTLAHELGHLVLDCAANVPVEKAANRFAGAFLMPAEVLWAEVGKQRDSLSIGELIELKPVFGVSLQMLVYRCRDLRIINDDLYRDLFREFKDKGWRDPPYEEPARIAPERPRRFQRLCLRAIAQKAVSESRGAELLNKSVRELDDWMDGAHPGV
jgi:Zn-dependent peptidase ImmA (M78 family)/transcriptional regulator with XRE-family HTH domain